MKKLCILIVIAVGGISCEKALIDKNPANDPVSNFNILWETVDEKYAFFELKDINWDSVKTYCEPQINVHTSEEELFAVMDSMLYTLRDGHVNLISDFNVSRNWNWYLDYPVNFNYDVIQRNYLGKDHRIAGGLEYNVIGKAGYIYYGSFSRGFSYDNLKAVLNYFKDTKGVIIDIRNNGGGSVNNAYALARAFINETKEALLTFEKTGPGHSDFGNGLSYTFGPSGEGHYDGPVVILTNRHCYSATNIFVAIMSNYSNVTIIGDQTGGGGGLPIDYELPNGWRFRFSATATFTPDHYNIELGIPPDIKLNNDPEVNASGFDAILERGLEEID